MIKRMRLNCVLIIITAFFIISCSGKRNREIKVEVLGHDILVYDGNKLIKKISNEYVGIYPINKISFATNLNKDIVYFNNFSKEIVGLELNSGQIKCSYTLDFNDFSGDRYYNLATYREKVIFKTNRHLLVFNDNLELVSSYIDSVFSRRAYLHHRIIGYWDYKLKNDSIIISVSYQDSLKKAKIEKLGYLLK